MTWVPKARLEFANDAVTADLVKQPASLTGIAVVEAAAGAAVGVLLDNPEVVEQAATAAAEKAQSDQGLARGVVPADRALLAGTIDADGRVADDAVGVDGHFLPHTYAEIDRRQGYVSLPGSPIIAGTVDADGRVADDAIGPDGHFLPHAVEWLRQQISGGVSATRVVQAAITGAGDSLMETVGTNTIALLGSGLGVPAHNAGKSGMTMEHIALTMGGLKVRFDVAGGEMGSAATPVALTRVAPVRGSAGFRIGSNDYTWHGYFTGAQGQRVHGLLAQRAGTGAWDFTPYSAGPSVSMLPGALFTPYLPADLRDTVVVLNGGRNNPYELDGGSWTHVADDLDNTVASLGHDRFVVLTITTRLIAAERTGEPQRQLIDAENARRLAKWPNNCFDLNRWMREDAVAYLGLPADPQDATDIAQGWIPRRLYVGDAVNDQTHFKATVYQAWAQIYQSFIVEKGLLP